MENPYQHLRTEPPSCRNIMKCIYCFQYSWRSDSMVSDLDYDPATQSVFSLAEGGRTGGTPVPSRESSNLSLCNKDSINSGTFEVTPYRKNILFLFLLCYILLLCYIIICYIIICYIIIIMIYYYYYAIYYYYYYYFYYAILCYILFFLCYKRLIKSTTAYYWTNSKTSELMVKSVCGYTIFYQTDNNVLPSMEQHQVKLK